MFKLILIVFAALAAIWCYNNFDLLKLSVEDAKSSAFSAMQNEKTVKTVTNKRAFDREQEEAARNY